MLKCKDDGHNIFIIYQINHTSIWDIESNPIRHSQEMLEMIISIPFPVVRNCSVMWKKRLWSTWTPCSRILKRILHPIRTICRPVFGKYSAHKQYASGFNMSRCQKNVLSRSTVEESCIQLLEGSLEVKLPTIWTDEKQSRAEAERRERLEERRVEEKESEERRCRCTKR